MRPILGLVRRLLVPLALAAALLTGCGGGGGSSPAAGTTAVAGQTTHRPAAPAHRTVKLLHLPAQPPARSVTVPVLTYHRVAPLPPGANSITTDLTLDPANFDAELAALAHAGAHTVTEQQVYEALFAGRPLPPHPVLITVDDGYVDDYTRILPALRRHHMVATFFVISGRLGLPGFLSRAQVLALDRAGMDIGDHTAHHVDLTTIDDAHLMMETAGSRHALAKLLGHPVYWFCYPFGAQDARVAQAVQGAGFLLGYTTAGGTTLTTGRRLLEPRLHVGRASSPSSVLALAGI